MRISLRQKNLEITPALNNYIETKILKPMYRLLKSYQNTGIPVLELEVGRSTMHHQKGGIYYVSATLSLNSKVIQAKGEAKDIYQASDLLEEELKKAVVGYQGKFRALDRRGARKIKKDLRLDPAAQFPIERASPRVGRAARMYRKGRILDEGN